MLPRPSEVHRPDFLGDVSTNDMHLLTAILSDSPPIYTPIGDVLWHIYMSATQTSIDTLPRHLQHNSRFIERGLDRFTTAEGRAVVGQPCRLHGKLRPHLLLDIMDYITLEIEVRIPRLLRKLKANNLLSSIQEKSFEILQLVPAMWNAPERYARVYRYHVDSQWARQEDLCAGCILARMGGEPQVLTALRGGLMGRAEAVKLQGSKRLAWVESWIKHLPPDTADVCYGLATVWQEI